MRKSSRGIIVYDNNILVIHRNKFGDEYYMLPGGALELGESPEECLRREIMEETSIAVSDLKLVFTEDDKFYGRQYVYLVKYLSGRPELSVESTEYKINLLGKNIYTPMWLSLTDFASVKFITPKLQQSILQLIAENFQFSDVRAI